MSKFFIFSQALILAGVMSFSMAAKADDCGEATEELLAAQQAYNEAVTAFQSCGTNLACQALYGPAATTAARELTNASNNYNSACH